MFRHPALRRGLAPSSAGWVSLIVFAIVLFAWLTPAHAALSCQAQTGNLDFGTYNPAAAGPNDSSGYVQMKCTCTLLDCVAFGYVIGIDSGASGSVADRRLRKSGQTSGGLKYALYRDLLRTQAWDTGPNTFSGVYLLTGFGTYQQTPIYGRMAPGQVVTAGSYMDTPAVTITF